MIVKLNDLLARQFILFLIIGGLNTLFGYACFAIFVYFGLHYAWSLLLATVLGIIFNFQTTGRIVFNNVRAILIFKFIAVYAFLYVLNLGMIKSLYAFSANYYLAGLIALFPVTIIAFLLNKFFVFRQSDSG